jgi:tetratricopeptide (TPR) repeat protein
VTEAARRLWQQKLDHLLAQEAVLASPAQRFELAEQIHECRAKLAELDDEDRRRAGRPGAAPQGPRVDLDRLPAGAEHFLGRVPELAALDGAWAAGSGVALVELIAPGGTGKTALARRWLDGLRGAGWGGAWGDAGEVFGWSFFSQGTGDGREASEDLFLATAIARLGIEIDASAHPADKGRALAEHLCAHPTLLVLDGLEPLQHPPGPLAGELRAPGLKALLTGLAAAGQPGLCVITSREWVQDLAEWVRGAARPDGPVLRIDLGDLDDGDGARLLHAAGADHAGAAPIAPDDPELRAASRAVQGHALTLSLLGGYLALAHGGDIRCRDQVRLQDADDHTRAGRVFRVMAAYETWLAGAGVDAARELAALRLFGFFDRPVRAELLEALRAGPPIAGLTEALFVAVDTGATAAGAADPAATPAPTAGGVRRVLGGLWRSLARREAAAVEEPAGGRGSRSGPATGEEPAGGRGSQPEPISTPLWRVALTRLERLRLIGPPAADGSRDAHPLVREYLAAALAERCPAAWREGHRRLYQQLKDSVPHRPDGLDGLQPLYQAVVHGCRAGLWQEVCDEVYIDRILRGSGYDGFYSTKKLGAIGADLGAVACLFAPPWSRPAPMLKASDQAWVLNVAAFHLRALGRSGEALAPLRAGAEMDVAREDWKNAAIAYGNLSELLLTLGRVADAVADVRRAVEHADRSGDAFMRMADRTILADALHQQGETAAARAAFAEAEAMQAERQPAYPRLYSLAGFQYCDLLLAAAERAAWAVGLGADGGGHGGVDGGGEPTGAAADCAAVAERATQTLEWAEANNIDLLSAALDHLTLARCALYADRLAGRPPGREAETQTARAVDGLRAAGTQHHIPRGLLTRAWLRHAQGDPDGARADLADAERIAARGGMQLFLADIALHRARLFHDRAALAQARRLIDSHGYGRRLPELADAEAAATHWPPATAPTDGGARP